MLYDIVLKDGAEIVCHSKNYEEVLRMLVEHSIFIVQENSHPEKTTYIMRERISHLRFPKDNKEVVKPV